VRNLYRAQGYGSLFRYCTGALRLSEDAACNRTKVTRACREFPMILDLMAAGTVSLTTVKMLAPHLTAANHTDVLARAADRSREEIEALVAELAPQPDVKASVRKLPTRKEEMSSLPSAWPVVPVATDEMAGAALATETGLPERAAPAAAGSGSASGAVLAGARHDAGTPLHPPRPAVVRASAPDRYRVQFTIDRETHEELRQLQALLRREIPSGDPGLIFGRAIRSLRREVEKTKCGGTSSTRPQPEAPAQLDGRRANYEMRIRPRTDDGPGRPMDDPTRNFDEARDDGLEAPDGGVAAGAAPMAGIETVVGRHGDGEHRPPSRHIPNAVKRAVWWRDRGQCGFVSVDGRRCTERAFLELHHLHPYALDGPATVDNIALRCWSHNRFESELIFGPYGGSHVREVDEPAVARHSH
jgi:hypothetical protein